VEDEYKVVCALSSSAALMTLSDPKPQFQVSIVQFKGEYLVNGASDPFHV